MTKIAIVGAGSMGSAFTVPCIENKNDTVLVGTHLENDLIEKLKKDNFHPAIKTKLPKGVKFEKIENLEKIINETNVIVAFPVQSSTMRATVKHTCHWEFFAFHHLEPVCGKFIVFG